MSDELDRLIDQEDASHEEWLAGLSPADRKAYDAYMSIGSGVTDAQVEAFERWLEARS